MTEEYINSVPPDTDFDNPVKQDGKRAGASENFYYFNSALYVLLHMCYDIIILISKVYYPKQFEKVLKNR